MSKPMMITQTRRALRALLPALATSLLAAFAGATCAQAQSAGDVAQMSRGAYLSKVGDCAACHTAGKGKPFAGGLPLATPFGTLYSTNITPDTYTGIGRYTFDDFAKALRTGVARDGHHLYPAMPYPSYSKIDNADMHALYQYFLHEVKPVAQANRPAALGFPFNVRTLMSAWNLLYRPTDPYRPDPAQSVEWNRGAYLVQSLMHCGACHTPHGTLGQEVAFGEKNGNEFLSGGSLGGWYAPNLRGYTVGRAPAMSRTELIGYLRSGRSHDGAAFGPMTEVIANSTQFLHDDDLNAVATYLSSAPLQNGKAEPRGDAVAGTPDLVAASLRAGRVGSNGAALYLNNCSACHRTDGTGAMPTFPALRGNTMVTGSNPDSLIQIVLGGSHMPSTAAAPTPLAMPDFGWRLDDKQVADVLSFVRSSWGNRAEAVKADDVAKVRKITLGAK
jgi:mono/diheme cytochrome c family protein